MAAAALPTPAVLPTTASAALPTTSPQPEQTASPGVYRNGPVVLVVSQQAQEPAGTPTPLPAPRRRLTSRPAGLYLPTWPEMLPVEETSTSEVAPGVLQWNVPRYNAGHHNNTPACGEPGNAIIVGHSVWYSEAGIFRPLLDVEEGDQVECVNADGQSYTYRVVRKWSSPYEDGSWLVQPEGDIKQLTLYTCNLSLTALVIVQAELIEG